MSTPIVMSHSCDENHRRCYLAFCVGEWYWQALHYLDREAFDARELGRHLLTLTCESMGIDEKHAQAIQRAREAAIAVCVSYSGIGGGGAVMIEQVRLAMVKEVYQYPEHAVVMPESEYEKKYHDVMDALRRSKMEHGDCKSGKRYGGVPKACSACMAALRLGEELKSYKGRIVRLA